MNLARVKTEKASICLQFCLNFEKNINQKLAAAKMDSICKIGFNGDGQLVPTNMKSAKLFGAMNDSPPTCFQEIPGKVLIGVVDQLIKDVSDKNQCKQICQTTKLNDDKDVLCKAAMFYQKDNTCILSSETRHTMAELFTSDEDSLYLENKCNVGIGSIAGVGGTQAIVVTTPEIIIEDKNTTHIASEEKSTIPILEITTPSFITAHLSSSKYSGLENSGYGGVVPEVTVISHEKDSRPIAAKSTPEIDSKIIDSYNPAALATDKPSHGVKVETVTAKQEYRFKLHRDEPIEKCFTSILPKELSPEVIVKSNSLKQCLDMCRLCLTCIQGDLQCKMATFSVKSSHCAFSSKPGDFTEEKPSSNAALLHFLIQSCT
uniref:Apple domain-containing protein n=1 Tax=Rhabditophanes sp. KR3021 TaxID=114890 RepID=A0AC35UIH5_9BILA